MNTSTMELEQRLQSVRTELASIKKQLQKAPQGSLHVRKGKGTFKYFQIVSEHNNVQRIYIRKDNMPLAFSLAKKRYNKLRLQELQQEASLLQHQLKDHQNLTVTSNDVLYNLPGYSDLLLPVIAPELQRTKDWLSIPYEQNGKYHTNLKFKTASGIIVRSKSESLIVSCLEKHNIPFRYECPLELNGRIIYPDFTIYQAKKDREIYWEHFGRADDPDYRDNLTFKLSNYLKHQLIPNDNLILTYETKEHPLTEDMIERIICAFVQE